MNSMLCICCNSGSVPGYSIWFLKESQTVDPELIPNQQKEGIVIYCMQISGMELFLLRIRMKPVDVYTALIRIHSVLLTACIGSCSGIG